MKVISGTILFFRNSSTSIYLHAVVLSSAQGQLCFALRLFLSTIDIVVWLRDRN